MQRNLLFLFLMSIVMLVTGSSAATENCSQSVVREFGFGTSFNSDIMALFDKHFPTKDKCHHLSAFLWKELQAFFDLNKWTSYEPKVRRKLASQVIPILHFRAMKAGPLEAINDETKAINNALKSNLLVGNLFDEANEEEPNTKSEVSCSQKVHKALHLKIPFVSQLAALMDGFNTSMCNILADKFKSSLLEFTYLKQDEWLAVDSITKHQLVESIFHLLHIRAQKANQTEVMHNIDPSAHAFIELAKNKLFFGDVFATESFKPEMVAKASHGAAGAKKSGASFSSTIVAKPSQIWQTVLWVVLIICASIAVYLGLAFIGIVPPVA